MFFQASAVIASVVMTLQHAEDRVPLGWLQPDRVQVALMSAVVVGFALLLGGAAIATGGCEVP